jgi:hypothetical protein
MILFKKHKHLVLFEKVKKKTFIIFSSFYVASCHLSFAQNSLILVQLTRVGNYPR